MQAEGRSSSLTLAVTSARRAPLKVGDIVALSPSHPFTTFDKWRLIWEIDDNYNVVGTIETFF
jgi:D-serine dehydratase